MKHAKDSDVAKFYRQLAKKRRSSKAAAAAVSKMLRVIYWMLKEKRDLSQIMVRNTVAGYHWGKALSI